MKAIRSRCPGSMFAWILNTKPVIFGSAACTTRSSAVRGKGPGECLTNELRSSRTPKLLTAEPKNTGVCRAAR